MGNCNSRKRNQFSCANINNKRSHFASFPWILITQRFFPSFPSVHAQKAGSFVLGHLTDVRDFRCPVLFINIILSKFVLPRANITSGKNSAFMRRKGVFQELSTEFPLPRGTSHGSPRLPALQGTVLNMCKVSIFLTGTITNAMQE